MAEQLPTKERLTVLPMTLRAAREITRLCTDGTRNACSFLYRVCVRVARSMGYSRVLTYTLDDEGGASLRGAGFKLTRRTRAESWSRPSRARIDKHPTQHKLRWEAAAA